MGWLLSRTASFCCPTYCCHLLLDWISELDGESLTLENFQMVCGEVWTCLVWTLLGSKFAAPRGAGQLSPGMLFPGYSYQLGWYKGQKQLYVTSLVTITQLHILWWLSEGIFLKRSVRAHSTLFPQCSSLPILHFPSTWHWNHKFRVLACQWEADSTAAD